MRVACYSRISLPFFPFAWRNGFPVAFRRLPSCARLALFCSPLTVDSIATHFDTVLQRLSHLVSRGHIGVPPLLTRSPRLPPLDRQPPQRARSPFAPPPPRFRLRRRIIPNTHHAP
jgi:hypothetical protein